MAVRAEELNTITDAIIGAAIEVHRVLGPGLLESAYEASTAFEVAEKGYRVKRQKPVPLIYKKVSLDVGYRLDLLINGLVVVEIKAVERLMPIHEAQMISYLKLTGCHVGLLINFNVLVLHKGVRRLVHQFPD